MRLSAGLLVVQKSPKDIFGDVFVLAGISMVQQLIFPIIRGSAALDGAFVRFVPVMSSLVIIAISDGGEPSIAVRALVWFDSSVDPNMHLKKCLRMMNRTYLEVAALVEFTQALFFSHRVYPCAYVFLTTSFSHRFSKRFYKIDY